MNWNGNSLKIYYEILKETIMCYKIQTEKMILSCDIEVQNNKNEVTKIIEEKLKIASGIVPSALKKIIKKINVN